MTITEEGKQYIQWVVAIDLIASWGGLGYDDPLWWPEGWFVFEENNLWL